MGSYETGLWMLTTAVRSSDGSAATTLVVVISVVAVLVALLWPFGKGSGEG